MVEKKLLIEQIVEQLTADLNLLMAAAKQAHEAATHEENIPEDKYDTQGLEASYLAQGQANRAQDVRAAIAAFTSMPIINFDAEKPIRISALVTLVDESGRERVFFLGPDAGGMMIVSQGVDITVITPRAPLGCSLIGKVVDDEVSAGIGVGTKIYEIIDVE